MRLGRLGHSMQTPPTTHCLGAHARAGASSMQPDPQLHTESHQNLARRSANARSLLPVELAQRQAPPRAARQRTAMSLDGSLDGWHFTKHRNLPCAHGINVTRAPFGGPLLTTGSVPITHRLKHRPALTLCIDIDWHPTQSVLWQPP